MKVGIVIGSVREGRVSERLARWVENEVKSMDDVKTELIDLKKFDLPIFDEPVSPQSNPDRLPEGEVKKWLDVVSEQDALILVTPEYNRSYSSVLKNALDYIDFQLKRKPVMLVAHGSTGGAQAVAHLRGVLPGLLAITTPPAVMVVGQVTTMIDEKGQASDEVKNNPYGPQSGLKNALAELKWYSDALAKDRD